jgi:hypothetical protein
LKRLTRQGIQLFVADWNKVIEVTCRGCRLQNQPAYITLADTTTVNSGSRTRYAIKALLYSAFEFADLTYMPK